jgi:hypothetical protein
MILQEDREQTDQQEMGNGNLAQTNNDARQAPVPAAVTPARTIAYVATAQATVPQDQSVTPLTVQENADNEARYFEALRVALVKNNVSLHLNRDQAAQHKLNLHNVHKIVYYTELLQSTLPLKGYQQ